MFKLKIIKWQIKENLLEYLLYLFIFLLPWQTRWIFYDYSIGKNIFEYGRMSLYSFDIILLIFFGFFLIKNKKYLAIKYKSSNVKNKILLMIIGWVLYCWLSVFWSQDKIISYYWSLRMLLGWGLFYLIQKINFSSLKLAVVVIMAATIQGWLAIWQFIQQFVWSSKWLGIANHSARELGASVVEFGVERWLRAYGSLPHPNVLGAFLVLSFTAIIYLIIKIKHKYHKLFLLFGVSFIGLGILFSYSRAAWLAFGLVYLVSASWLLKLELAGWIKKFVITLWLYMVFLLAIFILSTWPLVKTRLTIGQVQRLEIKSNVERIEGISQAFSMIKQNYWWGVGIGNYSLVLYGQHPNLASWQIQPVHNVFLLVFAELGIIGSLIWLFLNGGIVLLLFKRRRWLLLMVLLLVYLFMCFDHFWWTTATGLYLWWLIISLAFKKL